MPIAEILDNFAFLDDWEDKYRYIIELGRSLEPLPEEVRDDAHKVRGCASQVWLETQVEDRPSGGRVLHFRGDSDAHLVRGLIALLVALYSDRPASEIIETDALAIFRDLGLEAHLTSQRSNGVRAMVDRMKNDAKHALAA